MNEEEIIEIVKKEITNTYAEVKAKALQGLLDLYNKEKEKNKELELEKQLNEKIILIANNTISSYHEGYQAGIHKETTAVELVAEERERFIIAQEIKRLKDTIYELHRKIDEGNKKVEQNYISKDKIKEIIYPTPENPIELEIQNSKMYKKIQQLLEE